MTTLHGFARYSLVGLVNTACHAAVFVVFHSLGGISQTGSNLAGFLAAVSLSFHLNARFTFESQHSWRRYWLYLGFMGLVSLCIGGLGDGLAWPAPVTIVTFSSVSLVIGYLFSRHVVFAGRSS